MDVAQRIVAGEHRPGDRLFGRSSLAGLYRVSPETVRRAVALLSSRGVLSAVPGSGVKVLAVDAAQRYVEESRLSAVLRELEEEIKELLEERRRLDARLDDAIEKVVHYTSGAMSTMRHVEEVQVPVDSPLVGETLKSAQLRMKTGATVIGLARGREEIFSPEPDLRIAGGDLLVVVGTEESKERLRSYLKSPGGSA